MAFVIKIQRPKTNKEAFNKLLVSISTLISRRMQLSKTITNILTLKKNGLHIKLIQRPSRKRSSQKTIIIIILTVQVKNHQDIQNKTYFLFRYYTNVFL